MAYTTQGKLARVLFNFIGLRSLTSVPSGRLPFTIAKAAGDYPAAVDTTFGLGTLQIAYSEGLFIDYRHFDSVSCVDT